MIEEVDRSRYPTRLSHLHDRQPKTLIPPAERVKMVWELTRQAWTFKEGRWDEPRLRRDIVRLVRRGR